MDEDDVAARIAARRVLINYDARDGINLVFDALVWKAGDVYLARPVVAKNRQSVRIPDDWMEIEIRGQT